MGFTICDGYFPSHTPKLQLLDLLFRTRSCQASDPRDKVFAVVGMSESASEECLRPDYRKSTVDVYIETAVSLQEKFGLSFLSGVQGLPRLPNLPTWVPDWSQYPAHNPSRPSDPSRGGNPLDMRRHAGVATTFANEQLSGRMCLKVRGFRLDVVSRLGKTIDSTDWYWRETVREWLTSLPPTETGEGSVGSRDSLLCVIAPTIGTRYPPASQAILGLALASGSKMDGRNESSQARLKSRIMGRRLLVTEKIYVGLAPAEARLGDIVCIFLGSYVPFVLRRLNETFELIGECILDGVMEGQAIERVDLKCADTDTPQLPFEDFIIV
jgi:hypothetical protein